MSTSVALRIVVANVAAAVVLRAWITVIAVACVLAVARARIDRTNAAIAKARVAGWWTVAATAIAVLAARLTGLAWLAIRAATVNIGFLAILLAVKT